MVEGMIDSHCHLTDERFDPDREAVIARAIAAGVTHMVTIAGSLEESVRCIALADAHPEISCAVGVHPHNARDWQGASGATLRALARRSGTVRAIGETGLDYHYDHSPRDVQRRVFREQLLIAKDLALPAVVHCREAVDEVWSIVAEVGPPRVVLHCCTERWEDVERFIARGDALSFTGVATYGSADAVRETIKRCPLERIMIETDAPYLAPVPYRGTRNEPAFVAEVARCIADAQGIDVVDVDRITTANAMTFFGFHDS